MTLNGFFESCFFHSTPVPVNSATYQEELVLRCDAFKQKQEEMQLGSMQHRLGPEAVAEVGLHGRTG